MNDAQLIEHLHARGWSLDKIDVAMIREGAAAIQAAISDEQIDAIARELFGEPVGGWFATVGRPFARAVLALQGADALAAIKAALDLGIELTWQKMIMEIAGDTIDDMDSPLSAKVRELSARADAIRLLGEDAGRGES